MGDVQRIFYYHVPSAWTAFLLFFLNFVASIQYLTRRSVNADRIANSSVAALAVLSVVAVPVLMRFLPIAEVTSVPATVIIIAAGYFLMRRSLSHEGTD